MSSSNLYRRLIKHSLQTNSLSTGVRGIPRGCDWRNRDLLAGDPDWGVYVLGDQWCNHFSGQEYSEKIIYLEAPPVRSPFAILWTRHNKGQLFTCKHKLTETIFKMLPTNPVIHPYRDS